MCSILMKQHTEKVKVIHGQNIYQTTQHHNPRYQSEHKKSHNIPSQGSF